MIGEHWRIALLVARQAVIFRSLVFDVWRFLDPISRAITVHSQKHARQHAVLQLS